MLPEGSSFPQCPICGIISALRNSALAIEKGKICTTFSSLKETGGVIQDAESLSCFGFFKPLKTLFWVLLLVGVRLSVLYMKVFHLSPEGSYQRSNFLPRMSPKDDLREQGESSTFSMLTEVLALPTDAATRLPIAAA